MPTRARAGEFGEFLSEAWEAIKTRYYTEDEASASELEDAINASAASSGIEVTDPDQYAAYSKKLSKTLARLSNEQQQRIFTR